MTTNGPGGARNARPLEFGNPLVRKLGRFVHLSHDDRRNVVAALSPTRNISGRVDILEEGDDPRAVNIVLDGWACRYRHLPNGLKQIVSLLLPGDPCDLQVFQRRQVHHAVGTLTPVKLAQISGSAMKKLMANSPALEEAFIRERLNATAIQQEWTVSLGRRTGIERVAHLFCEIHARLDAVGLTDEGSFPMPLTQTDMADVIGQTSVHINRMLQELRGMRVIDLRSRRLTILDHAKLQTLAMFEPGYVLDDEVATSEQRR